MAKRLLLVALAIVLAPLAVELALRISYDPAAAAEEIRTQRDAVLARIPGDPRGDGDEALAGRIPHPYLGWDQENRFRQITDEIRHFKSPRGKRAFEVLIVGGSVSGLVGEAGSEGIRAGLKADPRLKDRDVVVFNHGRGSFKQPQQVMLIAYLFGLGYRPDAVVNIDGFNEVALGMDNTTVEANPLYPHWPQYAPSAGARAQAPEVEEALLALKIAQGRLDRAAADALAGWKLKSAILGRIERDRVRALAARCGALQDEVLARMADTEGIDPARGPQTFPRDNPDAALVAIQRGWVESSRQIAAMCANHDILYVHILQPTLHDAGSKPLTPREIEHGTLKPSWKKGVVEGYPRLREAGADLLAAGVRYHDGSFLFEDLAEETYYDGCHFRGPGMDVFTAAMAAWILEALPE